MWFMNVKNWFILITISKVHISLIDGRYLRDGSITETHFFFIIIIQTIQNICANPPPPTYTRTKGKNARFNYLRHKI